MVVAVLGSHVTPFANAMGSDYSIDLPHTLADLLPTGVS